MIEKNSIFLKALNKENLITPPIWYMRQAGRYMPEYRAVRKNFKNFLDMCKNPEVCCELAMQPIDAFNLDTAILFSDILTIPDAMGLGVKFLEGEGPVFDNPIKTSKDIINIAPFDPNSLSYVYEAVSNIRGSLPSNIPLIGFCGSPWTLAAYSIEGRSSKELTTLIDSGADCLSLYWNETDTDLNIFRGKVALQGNLNPKILLESNNLIKQETFKILDKYKDYPGYIFNLGHGITPDISPDKIRYLTDLVRSR